MNIFGPPREGGLSRPFTDREQQAIAAMLATEAATCLAARNADRRHRDMPFEIAGRVPMAAKVRTAAQEWAALGNADRAVMTALTTGPKVAAQIVAETGIPLWSARDAGRRLQLKGLVSVMTITEHRESHGHVVNVYEITGKGRMLAAEAGKQGLQREVVVPMSGQPKTEDAPLAARKTASTRKTQATVRVITLYSREDPREVRVSLADGVPR